MNDLTQGLLFLLGEDHVSTVSHLSKVSSNAKQACIFRRMVFIEEPAVNPVSRHWYKQVWTSCDM